MSRSPTTREKVNCGDGSQNVGYLILRGGRDCIGLNLERSMKYPSEVSKIFQICVYIHVYICMYVHVYLFFHPCTYICKNWFVH